MGTRGRNDGKSLPGSARFSAGDAKRVLVVLLVPSVERDGATPIDQQHWVDAALEMFGHVFGGATAYPRAKGRDFAEE